MKKIEYNNQISLKGKYDVIVVGGGVSGFAAAISSARQGANTLLLEKSGVLGGSATKALVGPFMTSFSDDGETQLIRGIFEELVERMENIGGAIHPKKIRKNTAYCSYRTVGHDHVTPFEPEAMKRITMEMVNEAGVNLRLHTSLTDIMMKNDNEIDYIITNSKNGLEAFQGDIIIDCTGDGDVAALAGVPFKLGRESDHLTQPMTMFFRMGNIDDEKIEEYRKDHPEEGERLFANIIDEKRKIGEWTVARDKVAMYKTTNPGIWRFNITRVQKLTGIKTEDLTKAEIEGRKQVYQLVDFFKKYLPGFDNAVLIDTASEIGVRATRRIEGVYELKVEDLTKPPTEFKDKIALYAYPVDVHDPEGAHGGCTDEFNTANIYEIPYRILVPLKIDNLLVAGRCVSASIEALGAIRVMPSSMAMGQAAGTAAGVSIKNRNIPRNINIKELQKELLAQNVYLEENNIK